jgi:hypothetical protein
VGRGALLEHEDQLVARAIEGSHAAVGLGPDDQILELVIDPAAGGHQLTHMPPVHADEVDRAIAAGVGHVAKHLGQEPGELTWLISPEDIANSRCLIFPAPPTWPSIFTL